MTEEQREQCNALIQELTQAGIQVSLHEFRAVPGYRAVGMDGQKRRFQRDGEDPMALLAKMKRLFGVKDVPEEPEAMEAMEASEVPEVPEVPEVLEVLEVPQVPEVSDVPDSPVTPDTPDVPETQDMPDTLKEQQQPPQ